MSDWQIYWWAAYFVTLFFLLKQPSSQTPFDNLVGSLIVSVMGFVFWPIAVAAWWRSRRVMEKVE